MSTPVTVTSAAIDYTSGQTVCQCLIETQAIGIGKTFVGTQVPLISADLPSDWTDAQLCAAVATKLAIPASDVSVATSS